MNKYSLLSPLFIILLLIITSYFIYLFKRNLTHHEAFTPYIRKTYRQTTRNLRLTLNERKNNLLGTISRFTNKYGVGW